MPLKPDRILTAVFPSLVVASIGLPAIAELQSSQIPVNEPLSTTEVGDIDWGQSGSITGSIPPEVWQVMQSQTGTSGDALEDYANIFRGETTPEDIWGIAQSQLELPGSIDQSLSNGSNAPGSIPTDVWSVMQSQGGLPGNYGGETFGSIEQIFSGGNNPFDFSSVVNRDNWGISSFSNVAPTNTSNSTSASGWNPFRHLSNWLQKTPLAKAMDSLGKRIRGALGGSSFGFFTRNQVVKERDQANLFDQEIARMMAEPQLGESGEQWMQTEAQDAMAVLGGGLQSASAAMQIAQASQDLTSTQDVAKAVGTAGGAECSIKRSCLTNAGTKSSFPLTTTAAHILSDSAICE